MRIHPYALILLFFLGGCTHSSEAQTVYVTKTGSKYHRSYCNYLRYSKLSVSLPDAKQQGYTPCSFCKPDIKDTGLGPEPKADTVQRATDITPRTPVQEASPAKATTSSQCTARTKAGNRCKRMTTNANGRCWQHQE